MTEALEGFVLALSFSIDKARKNDPERATALLSLRDAIKNTVENGSEEEVEKLADFIFSGPSFTFSAGPAA